MILQFIFIGPTANDHPSPPPVDSFWRRVPPNLKAYRPAIVGPKLREDHDALDKRKPSRPQGQSRPEFTKYRRTPGGLHARKVWDFRSPDPFVNRAWFRFHTTRRKAGKSLPGPLPLIREHAGLLPGCRTLAVPPSTLKTGSAGALGQAEASERGHE